MPEGSTTIAEILSTPFLAKRLESLTTAVLCRPRDTVLWIGAGLSAKYARLPTWTQFLRRLNENTEHLSAKDRQIIQDLIDSGRLAIAAEYLEDALGSFFLESLTASFANSNGGSLPAELSYLCVRDVISTNYDTLLESALPWYKVVFPSHGIDKLLEDDSKIVKIHGSVAIPSTCVVSTSSYARAYNVNLRWYLTTTFSNCSVVFLGTSMNAAEPYFKILDLLRNAGRKSPRHWAVMSIADDSVGRDQGRRLSKYDIDLLPYIPDSSHSFLTELLGFIETRRGGRNALRQRLPIIGAMLDAKKFFQAAMTLWHVAHADIQDQGDRKGVGNLMNRFFLTALLGPEAPKLVEQCYACQCDIPSMWRRYADIVIPNLKTIHGLRKALTAVDAATGRKHPDLWRRVEELERETRAFENREK